MAELSALGYQPEVKGLVWVQGEADAENQAYAQSYGANLGAFFDSLRAETWFPQEVPIIVNRMHSLAGLQFAATVRNAQTTTVAARSDHVYLLNNDDQTLYVDRVHYSGPMQLEVGRRLANFFYPAPVPEPSSAQAAIAALSILGLSARYRRAWLQKSASCVDISLGNDVLLATDRLALLPLRSSDPDFHFALAAVGPRIIGNCGELNRRLSRVSRL